jgi:hypothetical protein
MVRLRLQARDMKYAFAIALMLLGSAASAATPEETFLAERDAFIAKLNPPGDPVAPTDAASKEMERARTELAKRLRGLIGPLNVKGFTGEGDYSVGSLFRGDMEFGVLDGLVFMKGKDTRLVVTTIGIATPWTKSPDGFVENGDAPKDLPTALKLDDFYTRATINDAAASNMGELPVTKPAGVDFVHAMLSIRRQDIGPAPAEEMLIGAIVPPRVYILSAPIAKIRMMPACEKLFKDADAKADKMVADNEKSKAKSDEAIGEESERVREQGDEAMRKCFAERVKTDPVFARLTTQAQDFVDALAAK